MGRLHRAGTPGRGNGMDKEREKWESLVALGTVNGSVWRHFAVWVQESGGSWGPGSLKE